jgi:type IV secretion system protein VirB6
MDDPMVFQFIGQTVSNATDAFVTPAAQKVMFGIQMLILTGVTLYITLTGYAIAQGAVQSPFSVFLKQSIKIAIIAVFALTVDGYINGVTSAFGGLEEGLGSFLSGTANTNGPTSIYALLDQSLGKGFEIVGHCFQRADEAGWSFGSALGWAIAGLVVATGTVGVGLLGGSVVIVAKFAIAVMFAIGPLFVASLMFPITARFFDAWFGQTLHHTIVVVIVAVVMAFAMKAFNVFVDGADFSGNGDANPMFAALQIGTLTGILTRMILQIGGMAAGLAGGISMAALTLRDIISPTTGGLSLAQGAGDIINPMSTRRDLQSGMVVTARRSNHLIAGNTMWNPAYRQNVLTNLGRNWGRATGGSVKKK